ncbi:hypothetical protein LHGZ1_1369 [Laribacter hongkongensis]|uniref:Uncharacterized protein n=1 Tax=Laribacter hongkongensis TaxID=168471 RepID=A0A248LHH3_9NEIS|nr:hypothetical protein LHGZ1_1369 [Laribacter hongkongensis]
MSTGHKAGVAACTARVPERASTRAQSCLVNVSHAALAISVAGGGSGMCGCGVWWCAAPGGFGWLIQPGDVPAAVPGLW